MSEIKALIEDIQTGGDRIWEMSNNFPDSMKGTIAKNLWSDSTFTYGIEYGALIVLNHLLEEVQSSNTKANQE